jgi:hypothetical protein
VVVRDASRAGFPKAEAELRALKKRLGTAALLECESLLSLCGGGKLASWGGALGVDRDCRELPVVGLPSHESQFQARDLKRADFYKGLLDKKIPAEGDRER